ncbi:YjbQ family protein [Atlantibacter subterranea]|nr:YjbQ family protein [Atlantibacter subterranea]MDA3132273.1 YjbQ family protein [Atlantibacter subterranea]UTJ47181.1 YjbQ family protein [Atlantibacter subterranea]
MWWQQTLTLRAKPLLPVNNGRVQLGTWQGIWLGEPQ